MVIALNYKRFGGVLGLIVSTIARSSSMILLLGLIPILKKCEPKAAISSILRVF